MIIGSDSKKQNWGIYSLNEGCVVTLSLTMRSNLAMIIGSDSKKQNWGIYSLNEGGVVTLSLT